MAAPSAPARSRAVTAVLWTLQVLLAAVFAFSALAKFTAADAVAESARVMGVGTWFLTAIGVLELAGAVALLVPRLAGLAAVCFTGLMTGAVLTQLVYFAGANWYMPAALLVVSAFVAWQRRAETGRHVRALFRR